MRKVIKKIGLLIVAIGIVFGINMDNSYGDIEKYSIKRGQSIEIKILENHKSKYSWEGEIHDNTIVELIRDEVIKNIENDKGADRIHVFRFRGLEKGESMVTFKLRKKNGVHEPVKLKTVVIEVE